MFDIKSKGKMTVEYLLCFLKSVHLGIGYIKNKLPNKQINKQTIHIRHINKYQETDGMLYNDIQIGIHKNSNGLFAKSKL